MTDERDSGSRRWPDLAGHIIDDECGRRHVLPVRVYFEDTDFSGVVYHASYVRWCERGRSDFLRLLGISHKALIDRADAPPAAFVVRRLAIEFLKPARIDDELEIVTRVGETTAATLELVQSVHRDGVALAEAKVLVLVVTTAGRPIRLPTAIRAAFGG
ncbi:MAG: YbgC/FadM family acyl-CoA thioesterase [Hyphomicrobiaceae bacterium]